MPRDEAELDRSMRVRSAGAAALALGEMLQCDKIGTSYNRVTAWCRRDDGVELTCAMVEGGWPALWERYDQPAVLLKAGDNPLDPASSGSAGFGYAVR